MGTSCNRDTRASNHQEEPVLNCSRLVDTSTTIEFVLHNYNKPYLPNKIKLIPYNLNTIIIDDSQLSERILAMFIGRRCDTRVDMDSDGRLRKRQI